MYNFTTKLAPFSRGFLSCDSDSKIKKMAAGFLESAKCFFPITYWIDSHGMCLSCKNHGEITVSGIGNKNFKMDAIDAMIAEHPEAKEDLLYIKENMPKWANHFGEYEEALSEEQRLQLKEGYFGMGGIGHANPDYAGIALHGTNYYREKVKKYREINKGKDDFYDAIELMMDAYDKMGENYGLKAAEMLKTCTDGVMRSRLERIVKTFEHAPQEPCRDFAEGCIVFSYVFSIEGSDSPGHFDQYMYPLWEKTPEDLRLEYLDAIWHHFSGGCWNLCVSGSDENGNDLTNSLSYAILDCAYRFKSNKPNLTLRRHKGTPKELMEAAYKSLATGCGLPAIYNDEVVVPALMSLGITKKDAHEYVMNGCNQIDIQSKSHMGLEDAQVSLAKAVEFALHNGVSGTTGELLGPRTGEAESFATFEDFYGAVLIQVTYIIDMVTKISNLSQEIFAKSAPNPMRSALIEGCIEKGLDYKNKGPIYGHGQILWQAIAETADSLAAIKKYVFEEKKYTLREVADMTMNDFEGNEEACLFFKNSPFKFGNDIAFVDDIAAAIVNYANRYLRTIKTFRGGYFSGGCSPFIGAPGIARALGALPCGRRKREPMLADSIGSTPGCDVNGPTALLSSCLKFDHTLPGSGFILNLKFDKSMFNSEMGHDAFMSLLETYFNNGGQQLQITVVSAEELIDAQENPEKYGNLIVRVGGYSDYFVKLSKDLQENVIARTMY